MVDWTIHFSIANDEEFLVATSFFLGVVRAGRNIQEMAVDGGQIRQNA